MEDTSKLHSNIIILHFVVDSIRNLFILSNWTRSLNLAQSKTRQSNYQANTQQALNRRQDE